MKTSITNSDTRPHGRPLVVARILVFTAMAATTGLFVLALPESLTSLATPCADPENQCLIGLAQVAPLARLGIAPFALAVAAVALSCLVLLLVDGVATVLIWHRSNDGMALLVALMLVLAPMIFTPVLHVLSSRTGIWQVPAGILSATSSLTLLLLVMLFPSGRFVPRWVWIPGLLLVFFGSSLGDMLPLPFPDGIGALLILGLLLCIGASQIYRYRRVSTKVERQQTKWVVYGFIFLIGANQLFWQPYVLIPALHQPDSLYLLLSYPDDFLIISILVVTFGIAILRHRLWDIDALINKTLVYGLLTGILGALYTGLVFSLSTLAGAINGQAAGQPVVLVISTLAIATLFHPVRKRIQAFIDRRFYRQKYDAEKVLAAFSATLRNEVNLEQIHEQILAVVHETMQPTSLSLWVTSVKQWASEEETRGESLFRRGDQPGAEPSHSS
jgi:hypothetical protein